MSLINSHDLWLDIVAATSEFGSDATALRVPLWLALQEARPSVGTQVRDFLIGARQFLTHSRVELPSGAKGGVLFCFPHRTPSNMNNLLPVAREALRRGVLNGILMGGDFREQLCEFAGAVPIVSAQQLTGRAVIRDRMRNVARLIKAYRQVTISLRERRRDLASSLAANRGNIARYLANSVSFGSAVELLLDNWSPTCVITTSDFWPLEHQLCRQASQRGIRSIVIQHGTLDKFWWPFVADLYCMWGDAEVDRMKDFGAPSEKLAAIGMPATDANFRKAETARREPARSGRKPVCLMLSNTNGSIYEPMIFDEYRKFLTEAVKVMPAFTLRVKLHPMENDSFYRQMGASVFQRLEFHPKSVTLQDAVADADVVTTTFSTAGLEAMIMDKPLIVAPALPQVRIYAPWPESGGGTYSSSAENFQIQATKLVTDAEFCGAQLNRQREFLAKSFANRGHSAERIVDLLEELLNQPSVDLADRIPSETFTMERAR